MTIPERITADRVANDTPLRLDEAVRVAFPHGGITVAGLRRERDAGRLVVERIAGKEFVTLAAINEMRKLCRDEHKAPASISAKGKARKPSGRSETVPLSSSWDAAKATVRALKENLANISHESTRHPEASVVSLTSRSPM